MARKRKDDPPFNIPLKQPDRSGPPADHETLYSIAEKRQGMESLMDEADRRNGIVRTPKEDEVLVGRLGDTVLWSISMAMFHLTLDFFVQHQYAMDVEWDSIITSALRAFPVMFLLFYFLHPHPHPPVFLPAFFNHHLVNQFIFFVASVACGSHIIYISNEHGYYYMMKQAPPLGVIWVWSIVELDLLWAVGSLVAFAGYIKLYGYTIF